MKEAVKERATKLVLGSAFFVFIFLSLTLIGYFIEIKLIGESIYSYIDYLLYLLGYGDIENANIWFRLFFSVASLIALSLLSSACTVTWLESRRILSLGDQIVVRQTGGDEFVAAVRLNSKKRDVYSAKIALIINVGNKSYFEDTDVVYIPKNHFAEAVFDVGLNSVIYKYFNRSLAGGKDKAELVVTATYSDIVSGEEFSVCKKYSRENPSDFIFVSERRKDADAEKSFRAFVGKTRFPVDFSDAEILDSTHSQRSAYRDEGCFKVDFGSKENYKNGDFQMLFVPIPEVSEWGVYHDMKCKLHVKLALEEDVTVTLEIKKTDGTTLKLEGGNKLSKGSATLTVDLAKYKRSTWESIKELCFTVFYEDVKTPDKTSILAVKECAFVLPKK